MAIEVTYSYTHYPGFCESAGFECTETIRTSKDGKLTVKFNCKLTHDDALLPLADASGKYTLNPVEDDNWKADGTLTGGQFKSKQKLDLSLHRISDDERHIRTTNTRLSSKDYEFEFRRKQKQSLIVGLSPPTSSFLLPSSVLTAASSLPAFPLAIASPRARYHLDKKQPKHARQLANRQRKYRTSRSRLADSRTG